MAVSNDTPDLPEKTPLKQDEILDACRRRDIAELQRLADAPGGFLSDELRQQAWPVLLGMPALPQRVDGTSPDLSHQDVSWKALPAHKDEGQVQLDVERAFVYYPQHQTASERAAAKEALSDLILSVLRRHPFLHYFQGYHDIAQVFLLVLPPRLRSPAVARLSLLRIRDFMLPTLDPALAQLHLLPALVRAADPPLHALLAHTEPFFALAGTLTMFAHDVPSQPAIARLFDALLARAPLLSVYLCAHLVLARRAELFAVAADDDPAHPDPDVLHAVLAKLPRPLDPDACIAAAAALLDRHPPETLGRAWHRGVGPHSVLRTARRTDACAAQTEAEGAWLFAQQVRALERHARRARVRRALWTYRRPAGAVGVAVLVAVVAYLLPRASLASAVPPCAEAAGQALASAWAKCIRW